MKHLFTLALFFSAAMSANAQFVTLTNSDQNVTYNDQTVDIWGASSNGQMEFDLLVVLNTAAPKVVNVKRYELSYPSEVTKNSFCWGECYNSDTTGDHPVWYAPTTELLYPATPFSGFHAYYDPNGVNGTAAFRYVWFDNSAPNDSSYTDVVFHATPVGVEEHAAADAHFTAFPVPSTDGGVDLTFDAVRTGHTGVIELHDALGRSILNEKLAIGTRRYTLPAGKLSSGLWFASLWIDGRVAAVRRVVVSGR